MDEINAKGNTVVLVTHEEDVAVRAHRIVRLRDGKIESDRPAANAENDSTAKGLNHDSSIGVASKALPFATSMSAATEKTTSTAASTTARPAVDRYSSQATLGG